MRGAGVAAALGGLMLAGCTTSSPEAVAAHDPFEPMNRAVYSFDETFDKYVTLPIAGFYLYDVPAPLRDGVHRTLANLDLPVTFANDVFQGRIGGAGETLGRFA